MNKYIIMSILSTIFSLFSCSTQSNNFESVDATTFAQKIEDSTIVRLDVRTAGEYAAGHIEKAINIDVMSGSFETKALETIPTDKTVALYCQSGRRSKRAANILSGKGYKVIELNSGYSGWMQSRR